MQKKRVNKKFFIILYGFVFLFSFHTTTQGEILSCDISVEEKDISEKMVRVQGETGKWISLKEKESYNLIQEIDIYSLSSHAKLLILPHMVNEKHYYRVEQKNIHWETIIIEAAKKFQIDEKLIRAVIRVESNFIANAISHKGAVGAMQLMPETQKELGLEDPTNAKENVFAGTKYLKQQLQRFNNLELALAAYNAGAGNVRKYGGIPPFKETQNFVKRVLTFMHE